MPAPKQCLCDNRMSGIELGYQYHFIFRRWSPSVVPPDDPRSCPERLLPNILFPTHIASQALQDGWTFYAYNTNIKRTLPEQFYLHSGFTGTFNGKACRHIECFILDMRSQKLRLIHSQES